MPAGGGSVKPRTCYLHINCRLPLRLFRRLPSAQSQLPPAENPCLGPNLEMIHGAWLSELPEKYSKSNSRGSFSMTSSREEGYPQPRAPLACDPNSSGHRLPKPVRTDAVSVRVGLNERDVAVAALRKTGAVFNPAQSAKHRVTPVARLPQSHG
jgi:hypothetical protein